ncbi:MAG TPA: hypothetical protein VGN00_22090 [Puia sp.]
MDTWYIIGQLLRNAFVQALYPSLENSVNIDNVEDGNKNTKLSKAYIKSGGKPLSKKKKRKHSSD